MSKNLLNSRFQVIFQKSELSQHLVADANWFDILELLSVTYVSKYFLIKRYTCIDLYCSKNMVAELIKDSSQTCTTMDLMKIWEEHKIILWLSWFPVFGVRSSWTEVETKNQNVKEKYNT